ncbi:MAG: ATP-binding protein, partial [Candidatus Methanomethylophilaceae archaeon]|nr:ATP-binding protein [Candidatus Methanomethylophilaceae archaeon]
MSAESDGLGRAISVLTAVCRSLINGTVAVVDDLDLHLHPRVVRWILEQYASDRNPN